MLGGVLAQAQSGRLNRPHHFRKESIPAEHLPFQQWHGGANGIPGPDKRLNFGWQAKLLYRYFLA